MAHTVHRTPPEGPLAMGLTWEQITWGASKAGDLLGYEPTVSIREGVRQFIAWYEENAEWYDALVRSS